MAAAFMMVTYIHSFALLIILIEIQIQSKSAERW